jgi:RNA 2',3'-cyclic 3'-phosphodiesterase
MPNNPSENVRAFVAVHLPDEVRGNLKRLQTDLKSAAHSDAVRWTRPEQIHLTLKFFGDVETGSLPQLEAALRKACAGVAPFELRAEGAGGFPNLDRPRVLWVGIEGQLEALGTLQDCVLRETQAWGEDEQREFRPHLTLARIKDWRDRGVRELAAKIKSLHAPQFGAWRVAEVYLMRSELAPEGARHSSLTTIRLAGMITTNGRQ